MVIKLNKDNFHRIIKDLKNSNIGLYKYDSWKSFDPDYSLLAGPGTNKLEESSVFQLIGVNSYVADYNNIESLDKFYKKYKLNKIYW